jgi:hypothetical protein
MSMVPDRPLADQRGVPGLVHDDLVHQLRRELVVFGSAPFTGAHHLAPVQQRAGVILTQAADRDRGRAAVDALRGQTRQPRDGVRNAGVGQLADVFGADDLEDGSRFSLGGDRLLDREADAGDDDFLEPRDVAGILRVCCAAAAGEDRGHCGGHGVHGHAAAVRCAAAEPISSTDFHRYPQRQVARNIDHREWKPSQSALWKSTEAAWACQSPSLGSCGDATPVDGH